MRRNRPHSAKNRPKQSDLLYTVIVFAYTAGNTAFQVVFSTISQGKVDIISFLFSLLMTAFPFTPFGIKFYPIKRRN
ncbi:MAG: hypothetical protein DUD28_08495 [Lactobacillus sp.]|nr:MAG: hypothetical protein DUD28_08495 [Lactobacillus sp.]